MLVHLAGLHAGNALDEETTQQANVDLPASVARTAVAAGIPVMLYRCSTHALESERDSIYNRSKREAIKQLQKIDGLDIRIVYMPLVHGDQWTGRFSFLNSLPSFLARLVFTTMAAFKPTCHIDLFATHILEGAPKATKILSDRQINNAVYSGVMRLIDLTFAIAVLVLLGWMLALVWGLIRLGSSGPGIFAQPRVGRGGKEFICYKFRTMQQGTPQAGTHEVSAASVTPIGKFLRKTKIDELPQIINIFSNEISLIGPRPCLPVQVELIEERRSRGVLDIKPGISGLAQINDIDMSNPVRLAEWDAQYLGLRSILLDLKITLATVSGQGQGDKTATDPTQEKSS
jgi:lipopolysaccharide/colanic/teichoic acid biosynthesis glycosyltransferase